MSSERSTLFGLDLTKRRTNATQKEEKDTESGGGAKVGKIQRVGGGGGTK